MRFAVAAFLDPEILIIDEVLAVGDANFQRKCLNKMDEVSKSGKTILFVSHNLAQVQTLCNTALVLEEGHIKFRGNITEGISSYVFEKEQLARIDLRKVSRKGMESDSFRFTLIEINRGEKIHEEEAVTFKLFYECKVDIKELVMGFAITDVHNEQLIACRSSASINNYNVTGKTNQSIEVTFAPMLQAGIYNLNVGAKCANGHLEHIPSVAQLEILPRPNSYEEWNQPSIGKFITTSHWKLVSQNEN